MKTLYAVAIVALTVAVIILSRLLCRLSRSTGSAIRIIGRRIDNLAAETIKNKESLFKAHCKINNICQRTGITQNNKKHKAHEIHDQL